ncbi:MAG: hypothetical protein WBN68_19595 [Sedimenticolaceae bacterium]
MSTAPLTESPREKTVSENDLERIAELASLVAAAQDALNDDMVSRLASAFSEGITLLDRLTRNEGLIRLLHILDKPEMQHLLISLSHGLTKMSREFATTPPSKGGLISMLRLARDPGTQEGLRSLSLLGKYMDESMRELHRKGM